MKTFREYLNEDYYFGEKYSKLLNVLEWGWISPKGKVYHGLEIKDVEDHLPLIKKLEPEIIDNLDAIINYGWIRYLNLKDTLTFQLGIYYNKSGLVKCIREVKHKKISIILSYLNKKSKEIYEIPFDGSLSNMLDNLDNKIKEIK